LISSLVALLCFGLTFTDIGYNIFPATDPNQNPKLTLEELFTDRIPLGNNSVAELVLHIRELLDKLFPEIVRIGNCPA